MKNRKILFTFIFIFFFFVLLFCNKTYAYTFDDLKNMTKDEIVNNNVFFDDYFYIQSEYENYFIYENTYGPSYGAVMFNDSLNYEFYYDSYFFIGSGNYCYVSLNDDYTIESLGPSGYQLFESAGGLVVKESTVDIPYKDGEHDGEVFFQKRCGKNDPSTGTDSEGTEENGESGKDTERSDFFSSVGNWFNSLLSGITQGFENVISTFTSLLDFLNPFSNNFILSGVLDFLGNILSYLNPFSDSFILNGVLSYLNPFSDNFILSGVLDFLGNILSYLNPFSENFILKTIIEFLINILDYLNPFSDNFLGKKIVELIKEVLIFIFVPGEDEINNLIGTVTDRFSFIDTIKNNINDLKASLNDSSYNTVLSFNVSIPYFHGSVNVIDLRWLSNYKSYTDPIFTGFFYLMFLWRLFIKVPNIIKGSSSDVNFKDRGED